ncbi:MAG: hypothetical protein IT373_10240 [Polyangiaceae bacterium]|nr:hypothetical protein [Polyangiaceae bacterium]
MTTPPGSERLHARLRRQRARLAIRRSEYRQRDCAKGAWTKLCRTLADAARAYAISEDDLAALLAEGHRLEPTGAAFEPPRQLVFVTAERALALGSRRAVALHLSGDLLTTPRLALVRLE